ncbi:MAG: 4-hydroxy-tetrahydrodipicolinate synthase [Clostridiales bacterium]|nr:4-hydroxy-tetrahydrodipicolinate synthase [Clostridiales bacterium]
MTGFLNGIATAMITPFSDNGVNLDELGRLIEFQIAGGVDALVILGTTGEPSTMTGYEKTEVIKYSVKKANGRVKIIVGTGSNDTKKAIAASKTAQSLGADGVLAVTPYYNKCTQEGLLGYYKEICDAVSIPVIAYNVPARTGVNILPETAERLAHIPNMAGIKEASGNMAQVCETMRRIRGKCDLYSGEDALNLPILAVGGTGVVSVVSNIAPELVKKVYTLVKENNLKEANEVEDKLLPLTYACFSEVNPIPVKAACNYMGFDVGTPRSPLTGLEDKNKAILLNAMKNAGLKTI